MAEVKGKRHRGRARRLRSDLDLPNNKATLKQPRLTAEAQSIQQNQHMGRLLYHNGCHVVLNNKPTCHETCKNNVTLKIQLKKKEEAKNKQTKKKNRTYSFVSLSRPHKPCNVSLHRYNGPESSLTRTRPCHTVCKGDKSKSGAWQQNVAVDVGD